MTETYFKKRPDNRQNESGRSIVEMLGTIAIITMITIGAITGIGVGMQMYRANAAQDDVEQIIQGVTDLYSWRRNPDFSDSELLKKRACENDIISRRCDAKNEWKSAFGTRMYLEGEPDTFAVVIKDVPGIACRNMQRKAYTLADTPGITNKDDVNDFECPPTRYGTRDLRFYPK